MGELKQNRQILAQDQASLDSHAVQALITAVTGKRSGVWNREAGIGDPEAALRHCWKGGVSCKVTKAFCIDNQAPVISAVSTEELREQLWDWHVFSLVTLSIK